MQPQVFTKTTFPQESIITNRALQRFFTNMPPRVSTKTTLQQGSTITKTLLQRFLPVCIIIFKRKNLSHNQDALLWHLISMYFQVSLRCSLNKIKKAYQNSSIGMVSSPNVSSCDFKVLPQLLHCYSI